jgi:sugar/nucleoside kinase (ribokinase family)
MLPYAIIMMTGYFNTLPRDLDEAVMIDGRSSFVVFCRCLNQTTGDKLYCVPVAQVEQSSATTIGLGDAFVGGFLPMLLE